VNLRPELASAPQQQIVEQAPLNGQLAIVSVWKINNHVTPAHGNELDRVQFGVRQITDTLRETESFQHRPARRVQAIATHFFPGKFFPLKNKRLQTRGRAKRGAYGSSGSAADDCNVKDVHDNAQRSTLNAQRSTGRI
jgi:hypothetical protein